MLRHGVSSQCAVMLHVQLRRSCQLSFATSSKPQHTTIPLRSDRSNTAGTHISPSPGWLVRYIVFGLAVSASTNTHTVLSTYDMFTQLFDDFWYILGWLEIPVAQVSGWSVLTSSRRRNHVEHIHSAQRTHTEANYRGPDRLYLYQQDLLNRNYMHLLIISPNHLRTPRAPGTSSANYSALSAEYHAHCSSSPNKE